jgi:hypothetical protein
MSCRAVPKLTTWIDEKEWKEARELLFSEETEQIREGCSLIQIWMSRGKVPTAVESTVNFLQVILSDPEFVDEFLASRRGEVFEACDSILSMSANKTLRLAYTTAVIRFVNELVDQAQKTAFASSIAKLADQLGLPRIFVEIRHDGTHDQMTSLELLRWAASEALKWLEGKYWACNDDRNFNDELKESVHKSLDVFLEQLAKIPGEVAVNAALEKNVMSRIIGPVEYLLTVERVMSAFLSAVAGYPRESVVIEVLIRLLARNGSSVFREAFKKLWITAPRGSPIASKWIRWIAQELTQDTAKSFLSVAFQTFAADSSEDAFKEKLEPLWQHLSPLDSSFEALFAVFSRAYSSPAAGSQSHSSLAKSQQILKTRKFALPEHLDDWAEVADTWKPVPFGK